MVSSGVIYQIHNVPALAKSKVPNRKWKGLSPFIYVHVCLFTLAGIKISKSDQNLLLKKTHNSLKRC